MLTGSLSGFRGLPGAIGYGASKAGLMYLAESMQADLRHTPVQVQLINPGFIRTRLTDKNDFSMPFIMEPDASARVFFEAMNDDAFKRSFPFLFSLLFRLSQFLPDCCIIDCSAPRLEVHQAAQGRLRPNWCKGGSRSC